MNDWQILESIPIYRPDSTSLDALLNGPNGGVIRRILTDAAPYIGHDVAATKEHILAADILILIGMLAAAQ